MVASLAEFIFLILDYFSNGLKSEEADLYLVMTFVFFYGIVGLFLSLGFQDYNYLQTQIDQGIDPFDEEEDLDSSGRQKDAKV